MSAFDPVSFKALLSVADGAPHAQAKGAAFELALKYLFESVGSLVEHDASSPFGSEQIDLAVANTGVFPSLPNHFLVECKDYENPVDSKAIGYFLYICVSRGAELAVVVAAHGLTGDPHEQTRAYSLAKTAQAFRCRLVVITRQDLDELATTEDVVQLMVRRYLKAFATSGLGA